MKQVPEILLFALLCVGCTKTVITPTGTATTSADGKSTTVQDNQGNKVESKATEEDSSTTFTGADGKTATMSTSSKVDFSETGLENYPSVIEIKDRTMTTKVNTNGVDQIAVVQFTKDPVEKVVAHFKGQLTKVQMETTTPDGSLLVGEAKDGRMINLTATKDKDTGDTQFNIISTAQPKK